MHLHDVERRKILVASHDKTQASSIRKMLESTVENASIIIAEKGSEAVLKINNDPPHLIIMGHDLGNMKAEDFVAWVLAQQSPKKMSVIWLVPVPEGALLVNEVATGQLQFVDPSLAAKDLELNLFRSFNFLAMQEPSKEYTMKYIVKGERLIKEGAEEQMVYLVKRGELKATLEREGKEILLGNIGVGEFVGEMAYINGECRSADVFALTPCELIEFPAEKLDHILFQKPGWSRALLKTLSKRLRRANPS